jgi:Protein of unknown function (DUF3800)
MSTFIDESGDTGFVSEGATPYFHLAAVWVPTRDDADLFREKIRKIRRDLRLRNDYEFKFSRTHSFPRRREAFLAAALAQEFRFVVSSIDKNKDEWASASRAEQHASCAVELAALLRPIYCVAENKKGSRLKEPVVVDDNADREFLAIVRQKFRGLSSDLWPGSQMVDKVSFHNSAKDEMIQLADMICGSVSELTTAGGNRTWYGLIADRDLGQSQYV